MIKNESSESEYINIYLLAKPTDEPVLSDDDLKTEEMTGILSHVSYDLSEKEKIILKKLSITVLGQEKSWSGELDSDYRFKLFRMEKEDESCFTLTLGFEQNLLPEEEAILENMEWLMTAFDLNEHPAYSMNVKVQNQPSNGVVYEVYQEEEGALGSENVQFIVSNVNTGNVIFSRKELSVFVRNHDGEERLVSRTMWEHYFMPGTEKLLGKEDNSLSVWLDQKNAQDGSAEVVFIMKMEPYNPDFLDPLITEQTINIPVGFKSRYAEGISSESGDLALVTDADNETETREKRGGKIAQIMAYAIPLSVLSVLSAAYILRVAHRKKHDREKS